MSQILDAFSTHEKTSGFFGFVSPEKLNQLQSPRTSAALDNLDRGKIRGPPWPTIFHMIGGWLLVRPPKKAPLDPKNAAARRQICPNRFKTGKACQTQWSLVACSGGGPSTTIMLRGLATLDGGRTQFGCSSLLPVLIPEVFVVA